jgi:hypothetical protein
MRTTFECSRERQNGHDRRGERDGMLTFGQRSTMATEGLSGTREELADIRIEQPSTPRR